jgi:S-DNA-T family DNA segregation ATPase FtsK/SpoIIIE
MAKKAETGNTTEKRQITLPDLAAWARAMYQRGILGVFLVSLSIVTFVGLLEESSGFVIDWWSNLLLCIFGWGSYIITLVIGGVGALILAAKMPARTHVHWHIVAGAEIIFFALLSLTHLFFAGPDPWQTAQAGGVGGYVGAVFSGILSEFIGPAAAGLILSAVLIWGVIVASGLTFEEWADRIEIWVYQARTRLAYVLTGTAQDSPTVYVEVDIEPVPPDQSQPQTSSAASVVDTSVQPGKKRRTRRYRVALPPIGLLDPPASTQTDEADIQHKKRTIEVTLAQFGVPAEVTEINRGPMVTQFGVEPGYMTRIDQNGEEKARKVRVSKIASLSNDLALALAAAPIRIEAPIPGRSLVGIEVPNTQVAVVSLRQVMSSRRFKERRSNLMLALGEGVAGTPVIADLSRMPHLLIAGTTGSGKSVCMNALASSLLFQNSPLTLRLVMIDPKRVEMRHYNQLPHLFGRVESDVECIVSVLHWLISEMQNRYQKFASVGARHLDDYNRHWQVGSSEYMPRIVTLIDELADLMLFAPEEVEKSICRLAQMARATGMHLIIATQRPSVDIVTGLIKANFPARIGFTVSSGTDSRVILDAVGAETLLGKGDMLYMSPESSELVRTQGCFVSEQEMERIIRYWQDWAVREEWERDQTPWDSLVDREDMFQGDELIEQAIEIVRAQKSASASMLQRRMHIGYPRAARLIDDLEQMGIVGPPESGGRTRKILDLPEYETGLSSDQHAGV